MSSKVRNADPAVENRDSEALQVKLDELIRAIDGAHNALLDLEELEEHELDLIRLNYTNLAKKARAELRQGISDTGRPDMDKKDSPSKALP